MLRAPGVLGVVCLVGFAAATVSLADDSPARLVNGVETAIADEQRVLTELHKGFDISEFKQGSGERARIRAATVEEDLRAAAAELVLNLAHSRDYLSAVGRLPSSEQAAATSAVQNFDTTDKAADKLDLATFKVPLERDVLAWADDPGSSSKKARVDADAAEITDTLKHALKQKDKALADARKLPPIPPAVLGSGTVATDPAGPVNGYPLYDLTLTLDAATAKKYGSGVTIVFPPSDQGGGGSAANFGCGLDPNGEGGFGNYLACSYDGAVPQPLTLTFTFYTRTPLQTGSVLACYGAAAIGWRLPPPPGCFKTTGP